MYYKYNEIEDVWYIGYKITFPDGTTLSIDNKEEKDGWKWYDEPPIEYLEWLESRDYNNIN